MSDIAKNFEKLAVAIERDRRKLDLFALFRREGQRQWEIVLSSAWAIQHKRDAIGYVGAKAAEFLTKDEAAEVGSIIIVDSAAAVLSQKFGGPGKYHGFTLHDVPVSEAIIVRLPPSPIRKRKKQVSSIT